MTVTAELCRVGRTVRDRAVPYNDLVHGRNGILEWVSQAKTVITHPNLPFQ
jgi:hypothetical protein